MTEYTPTTEEVQADYLNMQAFLADDNDTEANYRAVMQWERWLAEHDRQVAERAWNECADRVGQIVARQPPELLTQLLRASNPHRKKEAT